jgi:hypothetical protein
MRFNPKGLIVTAAGALLVVLAIQTGTAAAIDTALLAGWGMFWIVSAIAVSRRNLPNR